jgi:hypothetical protein
LRDEQAFFFMLPELLKTLRGKWVAVYPVITPEIFETLMPLRVGKIYIESFQGKGDVFLRYAVDIGIHNWIFRRVSVIIGAKDYVILGRNKLNNFDLRLNGIDGKLEFLRGPQI